ncbi:MAG: nucleotidyl transferase AbiEii/AbiGii toxin family protein [Candidatus Dadabacteria bacterium]|nr:nucleotidyl transferase AbiEii/AbiGii toxin family protein [Candidatus Dadabacteria bacterium]
MVLDALYNGLPEGHPKLLFKGGTSLSKAFGLVQRFSEDVDIVVYRKGLGFEGERDPTVVSNLSNKKRKKLFEELRLACSSYILEDMRTDIARSALSDTGLLDDVRAHNMLAFRQAWKKLEEAVPGSLRLLPRAEPRRIIKQDYAEMLGMLFGTPPGFGWIMEQLEYAESMINKA